MLSGFSLVLFWWVVRCLGWVSQGNGCLPHGRDTEESVMSSEWAVGIRTMLIFPTEFFQLFDIVILIRQTLFNKSQPWTEGSQDYFSLWCDSAHATTCFTSPQSCPHFFIFFVLFLVTDIPGPLGYSVCVSLVPRAFSLSDACEGRKIRGQLQEKMRQSLLWSF